MIIIEILAENSIYLFFISQQKQADIASAFGFDDEDDD